MSSSEDVVSALCAQQDQAAGDHEPIGSAAGGALLLQRLDR